ncbi:MAG TPA: nucleotidyl transferase AbiEii/AbiGii toxin family protein [Solirubrobacteraceae bacterium]|jgi:hypothetical protein|nr:nucleotidyl transferase AbiEii/AbiGii toxin family protein [Solirubrobacteraceae bacterium]
MSAGFKTPRRPPSRHGHLQKLLDEYSKTHGIAPERIRRWMSMVTLIGALGRVQANDEPRFLTKGGVSIELRLGLAARTTNDIDVVFRGNSDELLSALDEAFEEPYSGFEFRRKGEPEPIRDTGTQRLMLQVSFKHRTWQTLTAEVASPEADEIDLVPTAISLADFNLESPKRVACLSLRYQVAQKIHAVTEKPSDGRLNLRHWDLIDLILLRGLCGDGLPRVRDACVRTFERRGTHDWPPTLDAPDAWQEPYRRDASELGPAVPGDVHSAAGVVAGFIAAIDAARSTPS